MNHRLARALCATGLLATATMMATGVASADPTGSKNSLSFPLSCDNGQRAMVVVNNANGQGSGTTNNPNGQANFSPAHVVGTNGVFHPSTFDLLFTFAPAGGEPQSFHDTATKPNGNNATTCTINVTMPDGEGNSFSIAGTVQGWFS
jgi:hypothetical protein